MPTICLALEGAIARYECAPVNDQALSTLDWDNWDEWDDGPDWSDLDLPWSN